MTRIQLLAYLDPGRVEIVCNFKGKEKGYERLTAVVDTGAEISLFPKQLMEKIEYRQIGIVKAEQAGIAHQSFQAIEAIATVSFEDRFGAETKPFEIPVWFAGTKEALIGYKGVLDQAILHVDMLTQRFGWLEIDK